MDVLDVLASGIIGSGGALGQGFHQFLELCGRHESVGCTIALLVAVVGALDVSPDGDDTV
jgi:hypothetical protein